MDSDQVVLTERLDMLSVEDPPVELVRGAGILRLPTELMLSIFGYVIPPPFLLDPSLTRGSNSAWNWSTRMKKSIIMVCKAWYGVGSLMLYESIVFRRCTQIPALLYSLRTKPTLAAFIKHIHINCYIPGGMSVVCFKSLVEIYRNCSQLISIDTFFEAGYQFSHNAITSIPVPSPEKLAKLSCDIRDISLFSESYRNILLNALTELHLVFNKGFNINSTLPTGGLHFPCVLSLKCSFLRREVPQGFDGFSQAFRFPSLLRLTVCTYPRAIWNSHTINDSNIGYFSSFIRSCGHKLRYLDIGDFLPVPLDLSACPSLEHLVVGDEFKLVLTAYEHENLQLIDTYEHDILKIRQNFRNVDRSTLPKLKYVRRLDPSLTHLYDLPFNMSLPSSDAGTFLTPLDFH
ncbi:hypothetical protein BDQ17DRAFT_1356128 [Cyathus striatus]|nr:hypothetical protein BDQ17DRAFT_1356128 [Cyathus striatus]